MASCKESSGKVQRAGLGPGMAASFPCRAFWGVHLPLPKVCRIRDVNCETDHLAAYEAFIAPQRKAKLELPEHAFKDFCARIRRVAPDQAHPGFARLGAAVLLHDIGKAPWVHDLHQQVLGTSAPPGHDEALAEVFAAAPSSFLSAVEAWPDPAGSLQ